MKLKNVMDWLKTNIQSPVWSRGSLDGTHEKALALYEITPESFRATIDSNSSYQTRHFSILIHWTKSYDEAEAKAHEIFSFLKNHTTTLENATACYLRYGAPISIGKDENKFHEFTVEFTVIIKGE